MFVSGFIQLKTVIVTLIVFVGTCILLKVAIMTNCICEHVRTVENSDSD